MRFFALVSALAVAGFAAAQEAARFGSIDVEPCNFTGGQDVQVNYDATSAIAAGNSPDSVSVWIQGTFNDTGNQTPFFKIADHDFNDGSNVFSSDVTIPAQINDLGASNWVATAFIEYEKNGLTQFGGVSNGCAQ
ncbi:hypothetical protein D9758_009038 [Tetrapyrgos nigripes]|uniref:Uncharacterized protein n=1 Tax=Tetrapyrgos nigripes TaxID=182062 RepID=A0A8H5GA21_9AGAR|nr:hypothetical protein D9758_009038 [Tetrapyrgos nigripes]